MVKGTGGDDMRLVKKLIRLGDSTELILDPAILQQVDIQPDSEVEVSVEGKCHRHSSASLRER